MSVSLEQQTRLNSICPYFTRFPLAFPLAYLREAAAGQWVLDPFCGSGTALFAARMMGLNTVGADSNPVAVAIARAKLCRVTAEMVIDKAATILKNVEPVALPEGAFWEQCYTPDTLEALCCFRAYFMKHRSRPVNATLRALLMGLLHGPNTDDTPRYFSNCLTADYVPSPQEAICLWKRRALKPPSCNVLRMIQQRAAYLLAAQPPLTSGVVHEEDSRQLRFTDEHRKFDWIITSPPYYGMESYPTDQWLRNWFLGAPSFPDRQITRQSPDEYVRDLARVWKNVAAACYPGARLIVRVGDVPGIQAPTAVDLFEASLNRAAVGWKIETTMLVQRNATAQNSDPLFSAPAPWPENEVEVFARLNL